MKLTLKQKRSVILGLGIVGLILLLLGRLSRTGGAIAIAGLVCVAATFVISLFWLRCPNCGEYLGRNAGDYCQHCGKELDW